MRRRGGIECGCREDTYIEDKVKCRGIGPDKTFDDETNGEQRMGGRGGEGREVLGELCLSQVSTMLCGEFINSNEKELNASGARLR